MSPWTEIGSWNTTSSTASVRNVFTTIALTLNFLITLIGNYFLKRSNQQILLRTRKDGRNRTVPVTHLVAWQSLGGVGSYLWEIRRLPGGRYGLLMLWTGIFSLAHQYFINSFITSETISQECTFNQGLVTTEYTGDELVPATTWPAARLVYDAWLAASSNGGAMGIYDKIDSEYSNFKPTKKDLLGYWNCTETASSTIAPADWVSTDALDNWIGNQSFTYPIWRQDSSVLLDGTVTGFIAWSASEDTQGVQWSSRAIIAMSLSGDSPIKTSNYQCDIIQLNENWTMPWMPPNDTLDGWCALAFGMLRDIAVSEYGARLQDLLNGMVMITGSGNNAERTLPSGQDTSYGCISTGTKVGPEIFFLLGTLFIVLLLLVVGDLYSLVSYHFHQNRSRVQQIPTDYISWQLAAVRNSRIDKVETKDLAHYEYGWKEDKNALGFSKMGADETAITLLPVTATTKS